MAKHDLEKAQTLKLPDIAHTETIKIPRSVVETAELPAIPYGLDVADVSVQAALVLKALDEKGEPEVSDLPEKNKENYYRDRIVENLDNLKEFLDRIFQLYRDSFPTLPGRFAIYNNTLNSNIASLKNPDISTRNVIVNIALIVLPIIDEIQYHFGNEQGEEFNFNETIGEIRTCLAVLARMSDTKLEE